MRTSIILAVLATALTLAQPATASPASVKQTIRSVFGDRAAKAIRVAGCETGWTFDNHAIGSAGERSVFQIHPIHWQPRGWVDGRRLYNDVAYAARVAFRMSQGGRNWSAWSCSWA